MTDQLGLLASRLAVGLSYAAHGAQKAFGWFEGPGPEGAAGYMESLGFKPGKQYATVASDGEIAAGLMMALGLGGRRGGTSRNLRSTARFWARTSPLTARSAAASRC